MPKNNASDVPHERNEPRPDSLSESSVPKKLPESIQETLDNEEKLWSALYEGRAGESTESKVRYAAYASRVRTILLSAHRYVAYTSDIGESFRPVAHPYLVRSAYGISWAYIAGDVAYEGYKAYLRNQRVLHPDADSSRGQEAPSSDKLAPAQGAAQNLGAGMTGTSTGTPTPGRVPAIEDYRAVMAQRAIFQSIASMGLPAFTIHSIVKHSGKAMKDMKNKTIRTWGPIGLGLAAVPFLPYIFDKPVEAGLEWTFHKGFEFLGGPGAVHGQPGLAKEKEL